MDINYIAQTGSDLCLNGAAFYFLSKKFLEGNAQRLEWITLHGIRWRQSLLPQLATNLRVRNASVQEEFGDFLDTDQIPTTFNPYPRVLRAYFNNYPERRQQVYEELVSRVSK